MATVSTKCNGTYGSHYTLYLKYTLNSQNIANNTSNITVEMYAKSDSSSYGAYNTSAVNPVKLIVGGSTKVDKKIAMDFRSQKTVNMASWTGNVTHGTDGKLKLKLEGSFSISGTSSLSGGSISKEWELTTIPRASSVTCADGNIGSATTININRASSSFTHTITYSFNGLTGTIATKTTSTSIGWTIPTSFFEKIPNAKNGQGTITCQTYSGSTLIGTKTTTFNAFVINSEPTVDATVIDINETTIALTGDANKIVKHFSNAQVDITATAKNSATISSYKVVCDGKTGTSASSIIEGAESGTFDVSCVDSRGFTASKTITKTLVDYIKLAITDLQLSRPTTVSNTIDISLLGNYFNANFGNADNSLILKYRYKEFGGEWSEYIELTPTISENQFLFEGNLGDIYDFNNYYQFEFSATDKLMTYVFAKTVSKGIPLIDIGEEDLIINGDVNIKGKIQKHGIDIAEDSYWINTDFLWTDFKPYGGLESNTPKFRKCGNLVEIRGILSPAYTFTEDTAYTMFTLPKGYEPSQEVYQICQGSSKNKWLLNVKPNGNVNFSRYGVSDWVNPTSTHWLPFNVMYFVDSLQEVDDDLSAGGTNTPVA